jgi:hypothetical protein
MQGFPDHERSLAITAGGPGAGFSIALAEFGAYWDNHPEGRPDIGHEPVINFRVKGDGERERVRAVSGIAAWLGASVDSENGTFMVQRRFGPSGESLLVEAHFTPDHDFAYSLRMQSARKAAAA